MKYEEAIEKLEAIARELEEGRVPVDEMTAKLQAAEALLKLCKEKLQTVEEKIDEILDNNS